jgi:hypothetical protein
VTLRSAILQAEADPTPDTITFAASLTGQTITLASALPTLTKGETITGLGPANLTVRAAPGGQSGFFRVFTASSGVTVTISGLTITGGNVSGDDGGGIQNLGALALSNDVITGNAANSVATEGGPTGGFGGGVANEPDDNSLPHSLTISGNTVISSNMAAAGGGVYNTGSTATIMAATITGNTANTDGLVDGDGGGIWNNGTLTLVNSTVSGNTATSPNAAGGGILNQGTLTVNASTLSGNTGTGNGGGLSVSFGTATLLNSTVFNNTSTHGSGGGVSMPFGNLTINDSTVTGNTAQGVESAVGGIAAGSSSTTFNLNNTIVAQNNGASGGGNPEITGAPTSPRGNFIGVGGPGLIGLTNGVNSNQVGTLAAPLNPQLGPFQNNGGPTLTFAPLAGSPVIDRGVNAAVPPGMTTDQRGSLRIAGPAVDVGAVEFQPAANVSLAANPGSLTFGQSTTLTATVTGPAPGPNNPVTPGSVTFFNGPTPIGTATLNPNGTATITFTPPSAGTFMLGAAYSGNTNYPTSTSPAVPLQVARITTTTTLTASANDIRFGQPLTLTARVSPVPNLPAGSPGTVTFLNGSTPLATIAPDANGVATLSFTPQARGTLSLSAQYSGNTDFAGSPSNTVGVTVRSPAQTIGIFDQSTATWYLNTNNTSGTPTIAPFQYGGIGWDSLTGNWTGSGQDTVAVVDPTTETWYVKFSNRPGAPDIAPFQYGGSMWFELAGDWTGSGHDSIAVVDPNTLTWYVKNSIGPGAPDLAPFQYGPPGSIPVVGDWNGIGHTGIGVFDPATGIWYLRNEVSPGAPDAGTFQYGGFPEWTPIVGDWSGTGRTTVAVVDPQSNWFIKFSNTSGAPDIAPFQFGGMCWEPQAGAWTLPAGQGLFADVAGPNRGGLTYAALQSAVSSALARLSAAGANPRLLQRLASIRYDITILPGATLAEALIPDNRIEISATAAGRGWYTDASAASDAQFVNGWAKPGTPAAAGLDLLTTVLHELAHFAGRVDLSPAQANDGLMSDVLSGGHRRVQALDQLFAAL